VARAFRGIFFSKRIPLQSLLRQRLEIRFVIPALLHSSPHLQAAQQKPAAIPPPGYPQAPLLGNTYSVLPAGTCFIPFNYAYEKWLMIKLFSKNEKKSRKGCVPIAYERIMV
jgi:hypothetical protein